MHKKLKTAVNEKDVENIYRSELLKLVPKSTITSPHQIDGLFEHGSLRMLLEFKYINELKLKSSSCGVLIQALFYLKRFEESGEKLPNVIFVGDINECMAIHTNAVVKYLAHEIDWKIAPSEAHRKNPTLLQAMVDDVDILPFVYDVDDKFHLKDVLEQLKDLSENVVRKVRITKHNISAIFEYFDKNVLSEKCTLNSNEKANLFMQILINSSENYLHPKKKNLLVTKSFGEIHVNQNLFDSFFAHFEGEVYSPKEKEDLTGFVDRLVEDVTRRRQGFFSTPTAFVDLAHKYISETFGDDWKERFVIYDCCCGVGSLTRDYKFKELYLSTLEQSELDTINQMGYNPEATKFQFDFLNDDDSKLPQDLQDAINSGKEILFLINPPYQDGSELKTINGSSNLKNNIQNKTNQKMIADNWGKCSKQLYAQFLYRISKLQSINKNIKIGLYSPILFLTGESFSKFRVNFLEQFSFENGFMFNASHFSDVSSDWAISFTLFNNCQNHINELYLDVIEIDNNTFELVKIESKAIYNTDNKLKLVDFISKKQEYIKEQLTLKSPLNNTKQIDKIPINTLATITWQSNNVSGSQQFVTILSESGNLSGKGKQYITKYNFFKCLSFFTSRRLISGQYANWKNWNDEYLVPNENHPEWQQFVHDSLVYSLFESKSNQSSLRQIQYKDKFWDIKNEFFWLSKEQIMKLAEQHNYDELYRDAKNGENRFVYNKLFGEERIYDKLSPDAKDVLDSVTELLIKSIGIRKTVSEQHPEYHLNSFDCGWAQLKLITKDHFKEEHKTFRAKYTAMENRLRPLVFELGFLLK